MSSSIATCYLYGYVAHQHLLSFPTRRSSDLAAEPGRWDEHQPVRCHGSRGKTIRLANGRVLRQPQSSCRSEEHTSELQSLRHLVCRLLLEKKTNANTGKTAPLEL